MHLQFVVVQFVFCSGICSCICTGVICICVCAGIIFIWKLRSGGQVNGDNEDNGSIPNEPFAAMLKLDFVQSLSSLRKGVKISYTWSG